MRLQARENKHGKFLLQGAGTTKNGLSKDVHGLYVSDTDGLNVMK